MTARDTSRLITHTRWNILHEQVEMHTVHRVTQGSGISRNTVERVLASGPDCAAHGPVVEKLDAWITSGCPVPPRPPQTITTVPVAQRLPLTQHHLDALLAAVRVYGSQHGAAEAIGISQPTVNRWVGYPPGRLSNPRIITQIEAWADEWKKATA